MPRPDILVGQKGALVAVREASGKLAALPAKGSKYDLDRWLEYDGDDRSASEAQHSAAISCDAVGCIAHDKGAVIAIARHPAAITDGCGNADVLVLDMPKPADCAVPVTVIDVFDRWRNGAYALYLDQNDLSPQPHVRVETVAAHRGDRPLSRLPPPHVPRTPAGRAALPKPQILDALSQSPAGEQPAVAKPGTTSAAGHDPPELRPSSGDDDPGEDGQAAASDANDVSDAQ